MSNPWALVDGVEVEVRNDLRFKLACSARSWSVLSVQSNSCPTSVESIMTFSSPQQRGPVSSQLSSRLPVLTLRLIQMDIPPELWSDIVFYMHPRDVRTLLLVSSRFNALFSLYLFDTLAVSFVIPLPSPTFLRDLATKPAVSKFLWRVAIGDNLMFKATLGGRYAPEPATNEMEIVLSTLRDMGRLHSLLLSGLTLSCKQLESIFAAPRLRRLVVECCDTFGEMQEWGALPFLSELSVNTDEYWPPVNPLLNSSSHSLVSLTLSGDGLLHRESVMFPSLPSLKLLCISRLQLQFAQGTIPSALRLHSTYCYHYMEAVPQTSEELDELNEREGRARRVTAQFDYHTYHEDEDLVHLCCSIPSFIAGENATISITNSNACDPLNDLRWEEDYFGPTLFLTQQDGDVQATSIRLQVDMVKYTVETFLEAANRAWEAGIPGSIPKQQQWSYSVDPIDADDTAEWESVTFCLSCPYAPSVDSRRVVH